MEVLIARVLRFQLGRDHRRREGPSGRARVLARPPHPRPPGARRVAPVVHGAPPSASATETLGAQSYPDTRGRTVRYAVVPHTARSYVNLGGRTAFHGVVPGYARSYVGRALRYDLASLGTTRRRKVRPTTAWRCVRPREGRRAPVSGDVLRRPAPRGRRPGSIMTMSHCSSVPDGCPDRHRPPVVVRRAEGRARARDGDGVPTRCKGTACPSIVRES